MPWQQQENWNTALLTYTRRLIGLRRAHASLRWGSYQALHARDGLYAFARERHGERLVIVLNMNRRPATLDFSTAALPELCGECHDVLNGGSAHVEHQRLTGHELPARSGTVFRQQSE